MSPYWSANKSTPSILLHGSMLRIEQHNWQPSIEKMYLQKCLEVASAGFPMNQHCCKLIFLSTAFSFYRKIKGKGWGRSWKQRELRWQEKRHSSFLVFCVPTVLGRLQFSWVLFSHSECTNVGTIHTSVPTWPPLTSLVATGEMLLCEFKCCFVHCFSQNILASEQGA